MKFAWLTASVVNLLMTAHCISSQLTLLDYSRTRGNLGKENFKWSKTAIVPPFFCSEHIWGRKPSGFKPSISLVVPRCCEGTQQMNFLHNFTDLFEVKVFVYYKCPECIPDVDSQLFLDIINKNRALIDFANKNRTSKLLLRSLRGIYKNLSVIEAPAFDVFSNGKEMSAYLTHIVQQYSFLTDFVYFVHALPQRHVEPALLKASIKYLNECSPDGDTNVVYLALNYRMFGDYFPQWSNGMPNCKPHLHHIWKLFLDLNMTYSVMLQTRKQNYNAGQFLVSRAAIRRRSLPWWHALRNECNGTMFFSGCPRHSAKRTWADGHLCTQSLERIWHILFDRPPELPYRLSDASIPFALRIDQPWGAMSSQTRQRNITERMTSNSKQPV